MIKKEEEDVRTVKMAATATESEIPIAVLTCPAHFNDAQRQGLKDAGELAGLAVRRVINEPTAAALGYGIDANIADTTILVLNLGGGCFDVAVIAIESGVFEVTATLTTPPDLGGFAFDEVLQRAILTDLKQQQQGNHQGDVTLASSPWQKDQLAKAAESAKCQLSRDAVAHVKLPFAKAKDSSTPGEEVALLPQHYDGEATITRARYEALVAPLVQRILDAVDACLVEAWAEKTTSAQKEESLLRRPQPPRLHRPPWEERRQ
jgi:molecular chaperone DnaK